MAPQVDIFRMNVLVGRRRFPTGKRRELVTLCRGAPTQQLCVSLAGGLAGASP